MRGLACKNATIVKIMLFIADLCTRL